MDYITVQEAAQKWEISPRWVQNYCAQGRIDGAVKESGVWRIPVKAKKPNDPRKTTSHQKTKKQEKVPVSSPGLMPLLNTPFVPGHCMETIEAMENGPGKKIALAEYHYFSGQAELAAEEAELYLTCYIITPYHKCIFCDNSPWYEHHETL